MLNLRTDLIAKKLGWAQAGFSVKEYVSSAASIFQAIEAMIRPAVHSSGDLHRINMG